MGDSMLKTEMIELRAGFQTSLGILTLQLDPGNLDYRVRLLERTMARARRAIEDFKRRSDQRAK